MSTSLEDSILNYYHSYCELTIWFKKIILHSNPKHHITIHDITNEFIAERDRILIHVPLEQRRVIKRKLNTIATSYYFKVSHWSRYQKITVDMV